MKTVSLHDAQSNLEELVAELASTGEVILTRDDQPVARLAPLPARTSLRGLEPTSVGRLLRPIFSSDDDLLEDMLTR